MYQQQSTESALLKQQQRLQQQKQKCKLLQQLHSQRKQHRHVRGHVSQQCLDNVRYIHKLLVVMITFAVAAMAYYLCHSVYITFCKGYRMLQALRAPASVRDAD
jgi:hypothetical protein